MARAITDIYNEMVAEANSRAAAASNTDVQDMMANTSQFAIWKIPFFAIAFAIWTFEKIQDTFTALVQLMLNEQLPHNTRWYRKVVLDFQYGFTLLPDSHKFDNTGYSAAQIEASKIIKYAACNETIINNRKVLLIKVARLVNGELAPLDSSQFAALNAYLEEVRDAGVLFIVYNRNADLLRATIKVFYNALLIDNQGNRLDGLPGKPVEDAANNYLLQLPFNGRFSLAKLVDEMQKAYGCNDGGVYINSFERKIEGNAWQSVSDQFIPDAGYTKYDAAGLTINYIADAN